MTRRFGRNQKRRMRQQIAEMQWRHERDEYEAFLLGKREGYMEARERFELETAHLRQQLEYVTKQAVEACQLAHPSIFILEGKDDVLSKP